MLRIEYNAKENRMTAHEITSKQSTHLDKISERCRSIDEEILNLKRLKRKLEQDFQNLLDSTKVNNIVISEHPKLSFVEKRQPKHGKAVGYNDDFSFAELN